MERSGVNWSFVEVFSGCLRRLHFLAGKKWRKEPGKGDSPFAILPRQWETVQDRALDWQLACGRLATGSMYACPPLRGGSPRTESLAAAVDAYPVSIPRSRVPTRARRKKPLVGLARNGAETNPQPLTKSSGDLAFSFERSTAQGVSPRGRDSKGQGPLVTLAYFW